MNAELRRKLNTFHEPGCAFHEPGCEQKTLRLDGWGEDTGAGWDTYTDWCWMGHTLRKCANSITRNSFHLNPQGDLKTWRIDLETEMSDMGRT